MDRGVDNPAGAAESQTVLLGRLVELWSLVDTAARTYAARAKIVPAPARLLLFSLSHRRVRHASRLMSVLAQPRWAGTLIGHGDAAAYLRRFRAEIPREEKDLGSAEALQRTLVMETLIAEQCSRLIAGTAHSAVEHALRWQLADNRFAQHQLEVLLQLAASA
jgi:hypothetical protein